LLGLTHWHVRHNLPFPVFVINGVWHFSQATRFCCLWLRDTSLHCGEHCLAGLPAPWRTHAAPQTLQFIVDGPAWYRRSMQASQYRFARPLPCFCSIAHPHVWHETTLNLFRHIQPTLPAKSSHWAARLACRATLHPSCLEWQDTHSTLRLATSSVPP